MNRKAVSGIMMTLLLISMLTLAFNIHVVKASGTIYIRADGSVEGTDKIQRVGDVYTFVDNINDPIVVEKDKILIDGAGYTVQGTGIGTGIYLSYRYNVTLKNTEVTNFTYGIYLSQSSNNILTGNIVSNNTYGIKLYPDSFNNVLIGNTASNNHYSGIDLYWRSNNNNLTGNIASNNGEFGIHLYFSSINTLTGNNVSNNPNGIYVYRSDNKFYHNNFINNTVQVSTNTYSENAWDDGYPSGGNYWSDYTGMDEKGDGVGDTPYMIDESNQDNYPLMSPWSPTWNPPRVEDGEEDGEEEEEVPLWMQWWFFTIVAVVIIALVGAIYFLKKRRLTTPIATTIPAEGTV